MFAWFPLAFMFALVINWECSASEVNYCPNKKTSLSAIRMKRYLSFPTGSSAYITVTMGKVIMTHAPSGWHVVMEIDVLFPLPDHTFVGAHLRRKLYHRQKREFWQRLRSAIDFHNLNGHACVLRSICEAKIYLAPPGRSLVHDILRAIFTAPLNSKDFEEEYKNEYEELLDPDFCDNVPDCPFSLLHFVLVLNKEKY